MTMHLAKLFMHTFASALLVLCTGEFLVAETEALASQNVKISSGLKTKYCCVTFLQLHNMIN